ncbi:hypothetical protein GGX14DRAFT_632547 [Mycena pura]|uniref:Uncharacterized protein n=1 Tax=Mycena pura TaxID=153505 RepID=A0AAD6VK53_9AGAR|nr:hypothetical protein GGX14DRAFT_632547 [Mycena pura]
MLDNSQSAGSDTVTDLNNVRLKLLQQWLKPLSYAAGVHAVDQNALVVYYETEGRQLRRIDFGTTTEVQLMELGAACGNSQGMARDRFATRLDVAATGLLDFVERELFDGTYADEPRDKVLRAELISLNVYGSGGFEATSAVTRDENIIGSLVVVFPTAHTGGALTFEQDGLISKFDFPAQFEFVDTGLAPILPYAAFRNDAKFTMDPVRTGHRVCLTYNLLLADRKTAISTLRITPANEQSFENMLRTLLLDSAFLPAGGLLAAGLTNKYPMPKWPANQTYDPTTGQSVKGPSQIALIRELLRGHEARILTLAQNVGLETHVKLLYNTGNSGYISGRDVLRDDVADLFGGHVNESFDTWNEFPTACQVVQQDGVVLLRGEDRLEHLRQEALLVWQGSMYGYVYQDASDHVDPTTGVSVHWLSKLTQLNRVQGEYIRSDSLIEHMFGDAVLVVVVPAFGVGVRSTVA